MARIVGLNTGQQSFGGLFEPLISLVSQHENIEIFVDPVVFFSVVLDLIEQLFCSFGVEATQAATCSHSEAIQIKPLAESLFFNARKFFIAIES